MPNKKQTPKTIEAEHKKIIKKQILQLNIDLKRALLPYVILFFLKARPHYSLEIETKMASLEKKEFRIRRNIIYQNLKKLHQKGIVESYMQKSNLGAKRKYYYLTKLGERLFEEVVLTRLVPQFFMFSTIMENRMDKLLTKRKSTMQELNKLQKAINTIIDK